MQLVAVLGTGRIVNALSEYRDPLDRFHLQVLPGAPIDKALDALPVLGFAGALTFGVEARTAAFRGAARPSLLAQELGAVNVVTRTGESLHGDHVGASDVVEGLRHAGWDPHGARVVASGEGDDVRAVLLAMAESGANDVTLVARDAPTAERALPRLPAGVTGRAVASRDPIVHDLLTHGDAILRGDDALPLDPGTFGPHLTLVDLAPDLELGVRRDAQAAGVSTVGWADVESHRIAARLLHMLSEPVDPAGLRDALRAP